MSFCSKIVCVLFVLSIDLCAQRTTTLSDTLNVLFSHPGRETEIDSQVFIRNKERYLVDWKVYYDTDKKQLAFESILNKDTCTTFDYWRRNGKIKKKTKYVRDTTWVNPYHGPVFHWYYEETYCENGKLTAREYPNKRSPQEIVRYYCNGKKKLEYKSNADNSYPEGLYMLWYENGQKKEECHYKDDMKYGTWYYWSAEGKLEKTETYLDGKLIKKTN